MSRGLLFRWLAASPILLYQKLISPLLPRSCIYEPSCSSYARTAVLRHGVLKGLVLAVTRVTRCAPGLFEGGADPVPERFSRAVVAEGYRAFRRRSSSRLRLRGRRDQE